MNLVIDASVFVAASRTTEPHYSISDDFMARVVSGTVYSPSLVLAECAAAIIRATDDLSAARKILRQMRNARWLELVSVDEALAERSADAAIRCRTRGADSCYIGLAAQLGGTLVTWDHEMLERGSTMVETRTPEQWLQEQAQEQ